MGKRVKKAVLSFCAGMFMVGAASGTTMAETIVAIEAGGPIWYDKHAKEVCPMVAYRNKGRWYGDWKTIITGEMSACMITFDDDKVPEAYKKTTEK